MGYRKQPGGRPTVPRIPPLGREFSARGQLERFLESNVPSIHAGFAGYALMGGLAQILATICTVALFSMRNFAVGITLKKTEVLQTAIVGFVLLGERLSGITILGILIGFAAVMFLSDTGGGVAAKLLRRPDKLAAR